jgi:hypothetical protein
MGGFEGRAEGPLGIGSLLIIALLLIGYCTDVLGTGKPACTLLAGSLAVSLAGFRRNILAIWRSHFPQA